MQLFLGFITLNTQVGESLQDSCPSVNILGSLFKQILIHIKFYVELLKFEVSWTTKNCGFFRLVGSTVGCVGWATFEVGFVTFTTKTIGLTCKTTWRTSNTCYVLI